MARFLVTVLLFLIVAVVIPLTGVQASSWLGWGKGEKKAVPGVAAPRSEEVNGATPLTTPAPVVLSPEDMAITAKIMAEQTNNLKALQQVLKQREDEALLAAKISALARQEAEAQQGVTPLPVTRQNPAKPTSTPSVPDQASSIKPYVAPRVPVQEWQAISDAEKEKNPPRGNITVKPPPTSTAP